MNVNRLEQTVQELHTFVLRGHSSSMPITVRLKEIKKRMALFGKQTVELLINSVGKRTVVLTSTSLSTSLNPSFFYFFNPFFVIGNLNYLFWKTFPLFGRLDEHYENVQIEIPAEV